MTSTVGSATSSTTGMSPPSLNSIASGLQFSLTNLSSVISSKFDQYFPPKKRNAWKEWLTKFATEKPYIASFLLSQIALSGPPLALFLIMTITVVLFSLIASLLVGLLGAVLFIVAAVGFALIVVLPVLFFTTAAAVFVWLWGIGTYYIIKWFNEKEVPGVHTDVPGGLAKASGLSDLPGVNGESVMEDPAAANDKPPEKVQQPKEGADGHAAEGKTSGAQHHADGKENSSGGHHRKTAHKSAGGVKDEAGGAAGSATDQVSGVKNKVPV